MSKNKLSQYILILFFFFIIIVDRSTKEWAFSYLRGMVSRPLFSLFGIDLLATFTINEGAAFGIMNNYPTVLLVFRIIFIFFLGIYLAITELSFVIQLSLVLIFSGAISNVIDSLQYGFVIDMIHLCFWGYNYPIFNIADIAISSGAFLFLLASIITPIGVEEKK